MRYVAFVVMFSRLLSQIFATVGGMSKHEHYIGWAEQFIQTRQVVDVELDEASGEFKAISESGSSFFLERLEQAQALKAVLGHELIQAK